MKSKFAILFFVVLLIVVPLSGQLNLLHDTLIISTRENKYSGKQVLVFKDRTTSFDELSRPKATNGEVLVVYSFSLNSPEKLSKITHQIFTSEEIHQLIDKRCTLDLISKSSKILSASLVFFNGKPEIDLIKLTEFSKQIKQQLTLEVKFDREIIEEGYVQYYVYAYDMLEDKPSNTRNCE